MSLIRSRIKAGLALALIGSATAGAAAPERLPLPRWEEGLEASAGDPGMGFNNLLPPPPEALQDPLPPLAETELSPQDVARFFPGGSWALPADSAAARAPNPVMALKTVPAEVLRAACEASPAATLIDPQGVIPEIIREDLQRLLQFHRSEARIPLVVLILDHDQKLPERAPLEGIARGALTRGEGCLAVYPFGEPWRTRFFFSRSVREALPPAEGNHLSGLAEDCIRDAQFATEAGEQLQRFAIRLSTRLFALEKILRAPVAQHRPRPLQEVSPQLEAAATTMQVGFAWAWKPALLALALLLFGGGGIFGACRFWGSQRRRENRSFVWLLPDTDVPTRLGGNFSGGTGAVIHYGPRRLPL
jgi:hypothetical protein